jgi:MFS family permease
MKKRTYRNTIAILFALAWGFVILDRQAITFLFPILMETFNLNNAQTGGIVMVTGLGFVISSFLTFGLPETRKVKPPRN